MSNHPPHSHDPKKPAEEVPPQPTSAERLQTFWLKNEKTIYIACLVVILVVAGVSIFRGMQKDSADQVGIDYAAANTPEKLRAFAAANSGHVLAAAAELRIADEAYQAKNYVAAAASYDKAAADKTAPFAGRARIGAAMSKALAGQTADAETRLKQISNDTTQAPSVRGEATYHLATIVANAGRTVDAAALYKQVNVIAPGTVWAENAAYQDERLAIGTNTTVTAQPVNTPEMPAITFPQ